MNNFWGAIWGLIFSTFLVAIFFIFIMLLSPVIKKWVKNITQEYKTYKYEEEYKKQSFFSSAVIRLADIFLSSILIILLAPIMLMISISIKMYDNGNVFNKNQLIGVNDKKIFLLTFRTRALNTPHNITPIGKFIKQFAMDYLPAIFNVLKGELSFIGISRYTYKYEIIPNFALNEKPGLICLWFCIPKEIDNESYYENQVMCDMYYLKNRGLKFNFLLLLAVLFNSYKSD